jgi:hypothetical protein
LARLTSAERLPPVNTMRATHTGMRMRMYSRQQVIRTFTSVPPTVSPNVEAPLLKNTRNATINVNDCPICTAKHPSTARHHNRASPSV